MALDPLTQTEETLTTLFKMTSKQRLGLMMYLTQLPALTVMIFLRRKLGYRMLKPGKFIGTAIVLYLLSELITASSRVSIPLPLFGHTTPQAAPQGDGADSPLVYFLWAMVIFGLVQRRFRWEKIKQGELWHSYSEGISWTAYVLPIRETWCNRFVDPTVCFIVGLTVAITVSDFLGGYLMFSGFCLLHYEQALQELRIENYLDTLDGFCDSLANSKRLELFSDETSGTGEETKPAVLSAEATAGIPTGLAPDIEAHIQKRRQRKPPPDDLAG